MIQHPQSQACGGTKQPPLQFSLVVDDFGVKYEHQYDITHLLDALKTIYKISDD